MLSWVKFINDNFFTEVVQVFVYCAHNFAKNFIHQVCCQVVVHFPDFLVAGVVVQLQIFFKLSSTAFYASGDIFIQVDFPFAFDVTLGFNCLPLNLDFNFLFNALRKWINTSERVFIFLAELSFIHGLINILRCFIEVNLDWSWLAIQVTQI